jgi:hypothetical protein
MVGTHVIRKGNTVSDEETRPMIHIRLPKAMIKSIDHISVDLDLDRARTIKRLLQQALDGYSHQAPQLVASRA